ncbi:type I restriction endonuclease subunit R [Algoriphagus pacificus]|uniref:Type I restriction enzyme endonuclease subunit n=1 Tax=Algoriphagus pacificus TaxID=2811234 RepID=A0ABS3CL10_9BACT|nr:type I restriction endonuclease subunit R [Algoriphagus pacificus]MBN7816856.1 type I restriction endonuclease subunit R [Algoriphagus pacificus]
MSKITESEIELYALEELENQGFQYLHGPAIAHDGENPLRQDYGQVILSTKLQEILPVINPQLPNEAIFQAIKEVERIQSPDLLKNNEDFHRFLTDGIPVSYRLNGVEKNDYCWLIDFERPESNSFLAVNQFTILENNNNKRPDILLFINGIPLVVVELKNAADENATVRKAFDQIQTYKATIPTLFNYNAFCIVSDGHECKAGTISAGFSRYMAWKTADGNKEASKFKPQLETMIKGMLTPSTLLDLVRNFIVFEKSRKEDAKTGIIQIETVKKLAAYHQYFAVNKALISASIASRPDGDRKGGVVWHTQGSGKSLSMVFFSGKLVQALNNPTILVITDRNDLDDQLFDTFASSKQLLRQEPVQAKDRDHLKELLKVASGGIVFTTIQKFLPDEIIDDDGNKTGRKKEIFDLLSNRTNIIVIADEAHRTQYGFEAKIIEERDKESKEVIGQRIAYGFAKYMRDALPKATYVGFTGTPVEGEDKNTPAVFGHYIDVYDISDAVEDGATVRIYYESRLAKIKLDDEGKRIIEEFDKELEQEELTEKQKSKAKWTKLEAIVGHPDRLKNLAQDIVTHFENRQSVFEGKGMIVAMSRRIAAALYAEIIKVRPTWHDDDLSKGIIKVVMTASSSDGPEMEKHHTSKKERLALANRMKDPNDPLQLVIVRDMWLTGFDAPSMHTLYVDKPMRGHNLMQAIARVNRVFKDKPGGLVVDYLGIATDLKKALSFYSDSGGKGDPTETQERAVEMLMEKLEVVQQMFNEQSKSQSDILVEEPLAYYQNAFRFNYRRFFTASPSEKLSIILQAEEHILGLDKGKERFIREVTLLSKVFALSVPNEDALAVKDDVAFFQAVKARLVKFDTPSGGGRSDADMESAIKQVVDEALSSDKVIDIFDAAGLQKPEISILSEDFLMEIKGMKHQNLALELLKKLLNDEIKVRTKHNLVKSKALLEMLESAIKKYQNGLLTTAEIIQELIDLAKEIKAADKRGEQMGMNEDELAFYDALEVNDSAVQVLGDDALRMIAREITDKVRSNASIDWTIKESVRAKLMVLVRRTLNKYGYPPDKQPKAIETVLKQAELLADHFTKDKSK